MKALYFKNSKDNNLKIYELVENAVHPTLSDYEVLVDVKACGLSIDELNNVIDGRQLPASLEFAGVVTAVGANVTLVKVADRVAGLLTPDSAFSACADFCVCCEYLVVLLPDVVEYLDAVALLKDGIKAFTALFYLGHMTHSESVLLTTAVSPLARVITQVALSHGGKVYVAVSGGEERMRLKQLCYGQSSGLQFVRAEKLYDDIMTETCGLGVDIIIDEGVQVFQADVENFSTPANVKPLKWELLQCLGIRGRWVTSQPNIQLDPPDCEQLRLRCASIGFLHEAAWTMSGFGLGKYQNMMRSLIALIEAKDLKVEMVQKISLEQAPIMMQQGLSDITKTIVEI